MPKQRLKREIRPMTQSNNDKRSQVRIPVDAEICVRDLQSGLELGILANVHEGGFMVISDGGLKEDHLYQLLFETEAGLDPAEYTVGAECLWISETGTGDQIWAGFQIMDLPAGARAQLQELVSAYDAVE